MDVLGISACCRQAKKFRTFNKNMSHQENHFKNFIWIAIGLIVISIIYPFVINYVFSDWTKSANFGTTYGALSTIFSGLALAGVIVTILIQKQELQNQRTDLELQSNEMEETRKEFLLNRTTILVYNQLERFERCLKELTVNTSSFSYKGDDAISFLDNNKANVYRGIGQSDENYKTEYKKSIIILLKLYLPNKSNIEKFAHNAFNSVEVLKRLIYKNNLEIEELNDLKNLFFVNIGFINMGVIERISEIATEELEYLEPQDYLDNNFEPEHLGQLMRANIFLKPIIEFSNLRLTKANFEGQKKKWIENNGNFG